MTLDARVDVELGSFGLAVELSVEPGTTVAIVGPNGAGKTTLLGAIAGLRAVTSGHVAIDGRTFDDPAQDIFVPPERRPIGMVFQEHRLFPHLSALENVAFGLRSRGVGRRAARRAAASWLERVGLDDRGEARPDQLSGGQAQRVALARALAPNPRVLLLDEPLAALDVTTRNDVRRDLRRHLAGFPGVRLLVTHDPVDAAALADRVIVLDAGCVVQEGSPTEIIARPRSRWVADLAGTNLLSGDARSGGRIEIDGGGTLVVADALPSGRVFAAVPPRAVALHRHAPEGSSTRNAWAGRIASLEPLGDRVRVRVDARPSIVAEVTAAAASELGLHESSDVWVAIKATEIDVYPA